MRIKIAARKSDLARIQAYLVADKLKQSRPGLEVEFQFKSSLGDLDQVTPLAVMPEKGVFTADFRQDLLEGRADMVVHSWKDLPVQTTPGTEVVATLERADARDLLLIKKSFDLRSGATVRVLSSSPRREYNLKPFLPTVWPASACEFQFVPVRGNVPTRFRKLLEGPEDGLIVAKAALDRLLSSTAADTQETIAFLRNALKQLRWMVLPISLNPPAAAQGALAIEIAENRTDLKNWLSQINHRPTFEAVTEERKILSSYGGGCHQKIGVYRQRFDYGMVECLRGLTDGGEVLQKSRIASTSETWPQPESRSELYPLSVSEMNWFERDELLSDQWRDATEQAEGFWVARADAWPQALTPKEEQLIWAAGVKTWQALAQQGLWVHGCADSLGEDQPTGVEVVAGKTLKWLRLTHDRALNDGPSAMSAVATYRLKALAEPPQLTKQKFFFWRSGTAFRAALAAHPELIKKGFHSCGPGKTRAVIRELLGSEARVFWSWQDWLNSFSEHL